MGTLQIVHGAQMTRTASLPVCVCLDESAFGPPAWTVHRTPSSWLAISNPGISTTPRDPTNPAHRPQNHHMATAVNFVPWTAIHTIAVRKDEIDRNCDDQKLCSSASTRERRKTWDALGQEGSGQDHSHRPSELP
eukprot:2102514-Rhodomonas_salina.3